jgi:multidrug efflux pump subunit AcrA (membrane-fusion protein)
MLAAVVGAQMLVAPVWKNAGRLWTARRSPGGVRWGRVLLAAGSAAGLVLAALFVPIPHRVTAAAAVRGAGQQAVHAETTGRVEAISVRNGDRVKAGHVLARLSNPDLELEVAQLAAETRRLQKAADKYAALGRPGEEQAIREMLRGTEDELVSRRRQLDLLTVRAAIDGRVVFAERVREHSREEHGYRELTPWLETPLAAHNVGARWELGTPLCDLLPSDEFEAVLYVEQSDVPYVAVGQVVRLKLDSFPGLTLDGTVREIARMEAATAPAQVLSVTGGELPTRMDDNGSSARPAVVCYEVRASLTPKSAATPGASTNWLLSSCRGRGKISCGSWTCYEWARRKLFELWAM